MKTVFVHDHRFVRIGSDIFSPGKYSYSLFADRYLPYFGDITIVARGQTLQNSETQFSLVSGVGVSFIEFPSLSNPKALLFPQSYYSLADAILAEVDCVIVRLPSEIGNLFADRARSLKIPLMVEVVACPWDGLRSVGSIQAKAYAPLAYSRMKRQLRLAQASTYVTSKFLQLRYPSKEKMVGISDVEIPDPSNVVLTKKIQRFEKSQKHLTPLRLGFIGGIENRTKGVSDGIKALSLLAKQLNKVTFDIVGPGDQTLYKTLARSLGVESMVRFRGPIGTRDEILSFLDDEIDIYIHPSYMEGLPRAAVEAMSRACPIVASTAGGIPELVDLHWLHAPGDYNDLANKIFTLWNDKKLLVQQAKLNFNRSLDFRKETLEEKRNSFISDFFINHGLKFNGEKLWSKVGVGAKQSRN